jgi:hypothetical protein
LSTTPSPNFECRTRLPMRIFAAGGSSRLLLRLTKTGRDTCKRGRISYTSSDGNSLMKREGCP